MEKKMKKLHINSFFGPSMSTGDMWLGLCFGIGYGWLLNFSFTFFLVILDIFIPSCRVGYLKYKIGRL